MLIRKKFLLGALLSTALMSAEAQDDCVNYDERYPITTSSGKKYLWNPLWNFPDMKQTKVTAKMDPDGYFNGYLKYVPASYNNSANSNKDYPVIIFFHGGASKGNGSSHELCRLFKDRGGDSATHKSIPGRVERNTEMFSQTVAGVKEEFIVISPQFNRYTRLQPPQPDDFPSAKQVEDVINYVEKTFRIDKRKIFLTGFSNGANMIVEYAASSVARAKRVAAIMPISLCSQQGHENNTSRGIDAKHIGQAKLKTWFVHCESDNCGTGPALNVPNKWVEAIMSVEGSATPRYTKLRNQNPPTLYNCSDSLWHDAWSRAFDPNFKASFVYNTNGTIGPNDGINKNMYEWFATQTNVVLPVTLKSYFVRLSGRKVEMKWITTDEKDNAAFEIQRAGADNNFIRIGSIPGVKEHFGEKEYSFTDESPMKDLNLYRLVQIDVDGSRNYFDIKRVINHDEEGSAVIVSPNPVKGDVSAFVKVDRPQRVYLKLTDMTGKILRTTVGMYSQGSTEVRIDAAGLPSGVYLLKASGENINSTIRVVKN